jgi:hypothetical protein
MCEGRLGEFHVSGAIAGGNDQVGRGILERPSICVEAAVTRAVGVMTHRLSAVSGVLPYFLTLMAVPVAKL